jgi:hypothetical protein
MRVSGVGKRVERMNCNSMFFCGRQGMQSFDRETRFFLLFDGQNFYRVFWVLGF